MSFKLFQTSLVIVTGLCLVAHGGGNTPLCGLTDAESVDFDVVSTCGPPGRVTVAKNEAKCALTITGDDIGVPTNGNASSVRAGFSTHGPVPSRGGESLDCSAYRVNTDDDRRFVMSCSADGKQKCAAYFIDVAEGCNTAACDAPSCPAGMRLDLLPGECCPTCVECPTCVSSEPTPPKEPKCVPSECPTSCEANYELTDVGDVCCLRCAPRIDAELCAAGRIEYEAQFEATRPIWLTCQQDAECLVITASSPCATHCGLLVSGPAFGESWSALSLNATNLCLHCGPQDPACPAPPSAGARCVDGVCALATP